MDPFYTYVSIGAVIILIVVLIAFGVMMSELHTTDLFPPTYQTCPDMWAIDASGGCKVPGTGAKNRGSLSTSATSPFIGTTSGDGSLPASATSGSATRLINPALTSATAYSLRLNDSTIMSGLYPAISDRCSKKQWALNNGVVWDGVTNYNSC
jgi:hypothetical protein